ncbi:MAG TPA: NUDIX domain-containing protein, partial [Terriglobia bacterium]|nr:NUDIX domain-containing protein [Terriglobia bacterium]
MKDELVLGFPRKLLDDLGSFQGIQLNHTDRYLEAILSPRNTRFLPRSRAEKDPNFKQIIPYVLVMCNNTFLHYVRGKSSGEKRLVAMGSIGVGGHINPTDETLFSLGEDFYECAVQRELHEELRTDRNFHTKIVGLLNDDSTPVGQVHFGVVHLCELEDNAVVKGEACITGLKFLTLEELADKREQLEGWSQLCWDHLQEFLHLWRRR